MTENEAIKEFNKMVGIRMRTQKGISKKQHELFQIAMDSLEEIQQYRSIGTVFECHEAMEKAEEKQYKLIHLRKKEGKMDYVIKNKKDVYIRLNSNGSPVSCTEKDKTIFEYSKACNICKNLPNNLKKLKFVVEPVVESILEQNHYIKEPSKRVIEKENYIVSDDIKQWVEKFGICDDILKEAEKRRGELYTELSNIDKQFNNLIHEIELEDSVDLYRGWKERNSIKQNRDKRRQIKDELLVISSVLKMDFRNIDRGVINSVVNGLANRKFTFRVVEEEYIEDVM